MPARTIHFPDDFSLGWYTDRPADLADFEGWSEWVEARGAVVVPNGHMAKLVLRSGDAWEQRELAKLDPFALDSLDTDGFTVDDQTLVSIAHLGGLRDLKLAGSGVTGHGLQHLRRLRRLKSLDLSRTRVADEDLSTLHAFPELRRLNLNSVPVGDTGLRAISSIPKLEELDLLAPTFSRDGLGALASATHLRRLRLIRYDLTEAEFRHIAAIPSLEELEIGGAHGPRGPVPLSGFAALQAAPRLRTLRVSGGSFPATLVAPADVIAIGRMSGLKRLQMADCLAVDGTLRHFGRLKRLAELVLFRTSVGDDELATLADLPLLRTLELSCTSITGAGFGSDVHFPHLHVLGLGQTQVDDQGLSCISGLSELRALHLWRTAVSARGLRLLSALRYLTELDLEGVEVDATGFRIIARLPALERLSFSPNAVTVEAALQILKNAPNLREIDVGRSSLAPESVDRLGTMTGLRKLTFGCEFSGDDQIARLRAALPGCRLKSGD